MGAVYFFVGLECALDGIAVIDIFHLDPDNGAAASHLDMVVFDNTEYLLVDLDGNARAQFCYRNRHSTKVLPLLQFYYNGHSRSRRGPADV